MDIDDDCKGYRSYCDCSDCGEAEDQAYDEEHGDDE